MIKATKLNVQVSFSLENYWKPVSFHKTITNIYCRNNETVIELEFSQIQ
jgi:hypothetical protein